MITHIYLHVLVYPQGHFGDQCFQEGQTAYVLSQESFNEELE